MAGTERYVRNSTADFLVFTKDSETDGIEVRVQDHEVWLTQKGIGQLFDVDRSVVAKHLRNIFAENELSESTTCAKFAQVADNGKTYHYKFYSLPAIIAVGYRTNSTRATQFRQWATKVLDTFTRQGYVLDKDRLINGQIFDEDYFDHLVSEIQEIRASERRFYQKITDIYATAVDYSVDSKTTKDFLQPFRTKCTTLFTAVLPQRSLCNEQTTQKTTWGCLMEECPKREDSQSRCFCCKELFAAR